MSSLLNKDKVFPVRPDEAEWLKENHPAHYRVLCARVAEGTAIIVDTPREKS